ncbi:unnamed protein product [Effrenium voratum]|nr:unnamed protein product [Effrenium voratum]
MGCQPARLRPISPDTPKPAMIGQRVVVKGQQGIVALDNGDGTWNVEFDDDGAEGDFPLEDLEPAPNPVDAWCPAGAKLVAFPFTEKRPEGWTRFACFSDTHGLHDLIPRQHMPEADVLLHAGDFTNSGELEQIESLAAWLRAYPAPHKVVVAGNHDITFQEDYYRTTGAARFHQHLAAPYDCRKAREPLREWYIEDELREVRGYRIYGTPWQPAFCDWAFNLPRGEKLAAKWRQIPAETAGGRPGVFAGELSAYKSPEVSPGLMMLGLVHVAGGLLSSGGAIETSCIADATPAGPRRAVALGRFFTVIGAALVLGPALGGYLLGHFGGAAPFACASLLGSLALLGTALLVPEYLPPGRRAKSKAPLLPALEAMQLLAQVPPLRWYAAASGLFNLGMAVYGTVNVLWLKEAFGWTGQDVGHFLSALGAAVILSQVVFLPGLLRLAKGREPIVVQGAILLHAIKFLGYAWAPKGCWAYAVLAVSSPTFCAAPILSSLCTRHVPSTQQGLWSGSTSALNTAASVVGALIGSRLLALALQGHLPLGSPLYAGCVFHLLAACCVGCGSRRFAKDAAEDLPDALHGA